MASAARRPAGLARHRKGDLGPIRPTRIHLSGRWRAAHRRAIHRRRYVHVPLERLVLALVPVSAPHLRDARPMADHPLDQIEREGDAHAHPAQSSSEEDPRQCGGDGCPQDEQRREERRRDRQHARGDKELQHREQRHEAAAERERFDGLGLDHTAEQVPGAFPPDLLRLQAERAGQQALLEECTDRDGNAPLQPERRELQRHEREERERPGREPRRVESSLKCRLPEQPPCTDPQRVLARVREGQEHELSPGADAGDLRAEARARRDPEQPDASQAPRLQAFFDERPGHSAPARRPHLSFVHQLLSLGDEWCGFRFDKLVPQRPQRDYGFPMIGADDDEPASSPSDEEHERVRARSNDGRSSRAQQGFGSPRRTRPRARRRAPAWRPRS